MTLKCASDITIILSSRQLRRSKCRNSSPYSLFCLKARYRFSFLLEIDFQQPRGTKGICKQTLPTLVVSDSCNPIDCSLPGSSVQGILQARILKWVVISFSRGSLQPRNQTQVPCKLQADSLLTELQGKIY